MKAIETAIAISRINGAQITIPQKRVLLELVCKGSEDIIPRGRMTRAESIHRKRAATADILHGSIGRVLDYAKHETLRNIERHSRASIEAADAPTAGDEDITVGDMPAARVTFNKPEFGKDLIAAIEADQVGALEIAGQELNNEIGREEPFKMPAKKTVDFLRHRQNLLSGVPDEIHKEVEDTLSEGIDKQESLPDLTKRIKDKFAEIYKGRGKVVADTETAAAYSYSRNEAMKQAGITRKKWLHSPLAKEPRPEHIAMSGKIVPFDEPFPTGDPPLMYPHDPNGSPEDVISCHCISIPVE
jgi:hypothetical protein